MPKVTGMSSAMPADGPMPGRWLIIVPMNTPRSGCRTLIGMPATARPCKMPCSDSLILRAASGAEQAAGELHVQEAGKDPVGRGGEAERHRAVDQPATRVEEGEQGEEVDRRRNEIADRLESDI